MEYLGTEDFFPCLNSFFGMFSKNNNNNNDKSEKYARLKTWHCVNLLLSKTHLFINEIPYISVPSNSSPPVTLALHAGRIMWHYPSALGAVTILLVLDVLNMSCREFLPMIKRESHWVANWSKNWRKCTNNKRNCIILLGLARQQMVPQKTNVTLKFNWIVRHSDTIEIKGIMSFEFEL